MISGSSDGLSGGHDFISAYRYYDAEVWGEETGSALCAYRKLEDGFHVGHCFVRRARVPYLKPVQVGDYADWCHLSDHCPMVIEFDFERSRNPLYRLRWYVGRMARRRR